jgi:hypothetical protein
MRTVIVLSCIMLAATISFGQTQDAYDQDEGSVKGIKGLLDPSRLTISHAMSFGMASGGGSSNLQSQSFYSTMMQYKFTAPVTLNLNFAMPIHSSYSQYQNLNSQNLQSFDYFRNMPFDVSLSWKPSDRFQFNFSVVNYPDTYGNGYGYGMYDYGFMPWRSSASRIER